MTFEAFIKSFDRTYISLNNKYWSHAYFLSMHPKRQTANLPAGKSKACKDKKDCKRHVFTIESKVD